MKKLLLLVFIFSISNNAFSQVQDAGTLSFQVGYDLAVHNVDYTSQYFGIIIDENSDYAATSLISLSAQYNPFIWFSAGLTFLGGSYIEDPENAEADGNTARIFDLDLRFYLVNGEAFAMYLGPEFGSSHLEINRIYPSLGNQKTNDIYKGPHLGLNLGFNLYFGDAIGWFFQLDYTTNKFELKDYSINGDAVDLTNFDVTLDTYSFGLRTGLCFKFDL